MAAEQMRGKRENPVSLAWVLVAIVILAAIVVVPPIARYAYHEMLDRVFPLPVSRHDLARLRPGMSIQEVEGYWVETQAEGTAGPMAPMTPGSIASATREARSPPA